MTFQHCRDPSAMCMSQASGALPRVGVAITGKIIQVLRKPDMDLATAGRHLKPITAPEVWDTGRDVCCRD
jgi:hypothetical protein